MSFKSVIIAVLRSLTLQVYAGSRRDNARRCLSLSCMITGSRRSAVSDSGTVSAHPATFQHECYKSQQSLAATAESCLLSAESVWRFHPFQQISAAALWHIRTTLQKDQDFFSSDQHLASNQQRGSVCSAKISRLLAFLKLSSESSPLLWNCVLNAVKTKWHRWRQCEGDIKKDKEEEAAQEQTTTAGELGNRSVLLFNNPNQARCCLQPKLRLLVREFNELFFPTIELCETWRLSCTQDTKGTAEVRSWSVIKNIQQVQNNSHVACVLGWLISVEDSVAWACMAAYKHH